MTRRAFTLAELLVAAIIAAFVVGATYAALSQVIRARDAVTAHQQAFGRASLAVELIARDLEGALRDADLLAAKVAIVKGGSAAEPRDELIVFSYHPRPIRPWVEQAEGAEREAHFRIAPSGLIEPGGGGRPAVSLWRRIDPVVDETPDGGGLAAPLVDGVVALELRAADAESWYDTWDSDYDGIPHAVAVTVTAHDDTGRYAARARRTVAIDRVAAPLVPVYEDGTAESGGAASPAGNTGAPGATPGGSNAGGSNTGGAGGRAPTTGGRGGTGTGSGGGGATPR